MEGKSESWQTQSPLAECVRKMYEIRNENGDVTIKIAEDSSEVKAHRFILVCRSIVFSSMLEDKDGKTTDVLIVSDIKKETFEQFLEFLYTDKTIVTKDNIEELLLCADRFKTKLLTKLCTVSLSKLITFQTICEMTRISNRFKEKEMIKICLKIFGNLRKESLPEMLFTEEFLSMCPSCIHKIVEDDQIFVPEEVIFNRVILWSSEECFRQKLAVTPENQRKILKHILPEIRFPIMEHQFLNDVVCASEILTRDEKINILRQQLDTREKKRGFEQSIFRCSGRKWFTKTVDIARCSKQLYSSLYPPVHEVPLNVSSISFLVGIHLKIKDSSDYRGNETYIVTLIRPNEIKIRERMYATPVSECFPENYVQLCPRFVITLYPEVEYNIAVILASTEYVNEQERLMFDRMHRLSTFRSRGTVYTDNVFRQNKSCIKGFCIAER